MTAGEDGGFLFLLPTAEVVEEVPLASLLVVVLVGRTAPRREGGGEESVVKRRGTGTATRGAQLLR